MLKTTVQHPLEQRKQHRARRCTYVTGMREAPAGLGGYIARLAETDRSMLPRRHPGVQSVRPPTPARYGNLPIWRTRTHWLAVVVSITINERPQILAKHHITRGTFVMWARRESLHANSRTGRELIVRPSNIARLMECSERTVQRCRAAARELGLLVDVFAGRMLTLEESVQARYQGSPQRGFANESALTVPKWLGINAWQTRQFGDHVTPTSGNGLQPKNLSKTSPPRRARRRSRLTARLKTKEGRTVGDVLDARRAAQRLARDLIETIPFLYGERPGRLVPVLTRFATGPLPWTATDVLTHIKRTDELRRRASLSRDRVTSRPAAVLAAYLRDRDPQADHPRGDLLLEPAASRWPNWCGHCDQQTRQIEIDGGNAMARCSHCHPMTL